MSEPSFRAILTLFGIYQIAQALWMIVSPGSFFDAVAGFGVQNDHFIRDNATFSLAIGVGLLLAVGRPSWRFPVLLVTTVWFAAHTVNHLVDIREADPDWVGPVDFVALLVVSAVLAYLTVVAARADVYAADRR
jgi:hypothetical protein